MIAVTTKLAWYVARSSGIVAWATVTASILWGLTLSSRLVRKRGVPAWLLDLHRYLGTLSLVFVVVHLGGLWADNFVYFGWSEMFVPMKSPWKTGAVAWGIVAFYFLVAIQISSWMMRHMKRKIWHAIHLTSIGLWMSATLHTFLAGQDRHNTCCSGSCSVRRSSSCNSRCSASSRCAARRSGRCVRRSRPSDPIGSRPARFGVAWGSTAS